jgi:hypothetical protein
MDTATKKAVAIEKYKAEMEMMLRDLADFANDTLNKYMPEKLNAADFVALTLGLVGEFSSLMVCSCFTMMEELFHKPIPLEQKEGIRESYIECFRAACNHRDQEYQEMLESNEKLN